MTIAAIQGQCPYCMRNESQIPSDDDTVQRLRGQLQNSVKHLERAKRHWPSGGYDEAIAMANKTLYDTL